MQAGRAGTGPPRLVVAAVVLAIAYAVASVVLLIEHEPRVTSYFVSSRTAAVLGVGSGLAIVLVGSALALLGERPSYGSLAVLLGAAWLAPLWAGWEHGPTAVRTLAALVAPMSVPVLVHLIVLSWHRAPKRPPPWAAAAYALVGGLVMTRALVHDPERDPSCWVDCGRGANVLLVRADTPLARGLGTALLWVVVVLAAAAFAWTAWRLAGGTSGAFRAAGATVAATAVLTGEAGYALVLLADPLERFDAPTGAALFLVRSAAILILSGVLAWTGAGARATRARLAQLARDLHDQPAPGELESYLARTLHDPKLSVLYWSSRSEHFLDEAGQPDDPHHDGRARALLLRRGQPVAVVLHNPSRSIGRALEEELGAAGRLVIDNERLRVERLEQLAELRTSRARLVASADEHRRRLERDVHDGAQQRLLAAVFELKLARADALAAREPALVGRLDLAVTSLCQTLDQLRAWAHGVFPAVLDQVGLEEALRSLTDTAPFPVVLDSELTTRPSAVIERTAYLVVKAAIESAAGEDAVRISLRHDPDDLLVEVAGIGALDPIPIEDRVGAVGGRLQLGVGVLKAVIPCGSS